jgi:PKD repeat protein
VITNAGSAQAARPSGGTGRGHGSTPTASAVAAAATPGGSGSAGAGSTGSSGAPSRLPLRSGYPAGHARSAGANRAPGQPGLRAAAPTARALAQSLEQSTGLAPSQVSQRDVCPAATAGRVRCAAQVLVLRSDGATVRPHVRAHGSLGRVQPATAGGRVTPAGVAASAPPQAGTPAFLEQAYDLSYLSQTGGQHDTVAIVDAYDDPSAQADLTTFRSTYGLPACTTSNGCFEKVGESGQSQPLPSVNSGWQEEESLDLDAVSSVCPNCHILLVEANSSGTSDLDTAMATAKSMGANQISDSWSITASKVPSGTYTFPGVATVAATGDDGYVGPGQDNYPAAIPGVTAAGGTSLAPGTSAPNARGFGESAWSLDAQGNGGGSGCDLQERKPSYQTDSGCTGRSYADVSADANPQTGLDVYDSAAGGWLMFGGTSLATPEIASYYAITGVADSTPQWAYGDSSALNDIVSGSNGTCASGILYICNAGVGYDGPTGVGSISGSAVTGAPGIGGAPINSGSANTYTESVASDGAAVAGGIYPNGLDTTWWIQYGTTTAYGSQTAASDVGAGASPVAVNGYLLHLAPNATYHYRLVAQNSVGTTYGYDYTFTTAAASSSTPAASFTTSPGVPAPGVGATFNAGGSTDGGATITDYWWDFGDGTTEDAGSSPGVSHTYSARGVYQVTLVVTNNQGQHDIVTQTVAADDPPAVAFTSQATAATPGSNLSFTGTASAQAGGTIADYKWNFGDGATGDTGTTPSDSHTYANPGVYTVTLTATDDLGVSSTATEAVTVDAPPAAAFTAPDPAVPGTSANFNAGSSTDAFGTITDYRWNFGDGTTDDSGNKPTDTHTYAARGQYQVTLTVTNDAGQTATATQTVTADDPPRVAFTPSTTLTTPGVPVSFAGTGSSPDASGTITDYKWNFGDGTTDDTGTGVAATHTYATSGVYTVTLTATDDLGVTASAKQVVTVDAAPTAAFTSSPATPTPGSTITFGAGGSTDAVGTITTYSWNFGDGAAATGPNPTHTYIARGSYQVTLTVTNDAGQTATATKTIAIDNPPTAAFTPSATVTTPGTQLSFDGTQSTPGAGGTIADYRWNFGDGTTADTGTTPTATHAYTAPGTYTITLTTTDDLGVTAAATRVVTVAVPPVVTPTPAPAPAPSPAPEPAPAPSPTPTAPTTPRVKPAPPPLTGGVTAPGHQTRASVTKHGLRLTVSLSVGGQASFQITIPRAPGRARDGKRGAKPAPITLLRIRARALASGNQPVTFYLPRSAVRQLGARGMVVVTVHITITDAYGAVITRSVSITLHR